MREVDQALAHAYARRTTVRDAVPPPPHVRLRNDATGRDPGLPTFEPDPIELRWPATVMTLERDFGERFARAARVLTDARDRLNQKVLLVTSCQRAEGRTTLVLTLARSLARLPGRTLVVDADLTGPMLDRLLGLRAAFGLDDVVEQGHALADALIEAPHDHLSLLPLRAPVARPRAFLRRATWPVTMARLRREFDLVLLDGGPLFHGLDPAPLHPSVDAAVLVRNRSITNQAAVIRARNVLESGGIPLFGVAETFVT
jgi:protein-tyrosine kinase